MSKRANKQNRASAGPAPRVVPQDRLNALNAAIADAGTLREQAQAILARANEQITAATKRVAELHNAIVTEYAIAPDQQYHRVTGVIGPREAPAA